MFHLQWHICELAGEVFFFVSKATLKKNMQASDEMTSFSFRAEKCNEQA